MKLSIIIPTYNEEKTIKELIRMVTSVHYPCDYEVIIIDDCSIDRTYEREILLRLKRGMSHVRLFRNRVNKGKGASIREGIKHAKGDIFIIQDADTEYHPREIPALIKPLLEGKAEVVYGSRFLHQWHPEGMALPNWMANRILTQLTNWLFNARLTDMETCYKAMRTSLVKKLKLRCDRFNFEPEITALLLKQKVKIVELPIPYQGRTAKEGKKIKAKDFFHAIGTLFYYRFS